MSTPTDHPRETTPDTLSFPQDDSQCPVDYQSDSDPDDALEQTPLTSTVGQTRSRSRSCFLVCSRDSKRRSRKVPIAILSTFFSVFAFSQLYQTFGPEASASLPERLENSRWIATSHSWLDRNLCRWFGVCGFWHLNRNGWTWEDQRNLEKNKTHHEHIDPSGFWTDESADPAGWSAQERALREIPSYVLEYAPFVHLYSGEQYWPCDIAQHLIHTTPNLNYTPIQASSDHPTLTKLDNLNQWGRFVYLKSDDNVEQQPKWLLGRENIPSATRNSYGSSDSSNDNLLSVANLASVPSDEEEGRKDDLRRSVEPDPSAEPGRSKAPAVLIVVNKGDGVVDAFWFFFYSFNLGNEVFNIRFGNHVGDWEHTLIRFRNGKPESVFLSEHDFGEAYTYGAVEKIGKRPVVYSATGTHAMYATPGTHPYVLPWGLLHDETDRGPLWDPLLNLHSFTYDVANDSLRSSTYSPRAPIGWFYFMGHWGDKYYPLDDPRQYRFAGQYHYVNGPLGPRFKNLGRETICQSHHRECEIQDQLAQGRLRLKRWAGFGEGEELAEEEERRLLGSVDPEQGKATDD